MGKRFVSIWFRYLLTDWFTIQGTHLRNTPLVLSAPSHGKMIITAANDLATAQRIDKGMSVADARAIIPGLQVLDDKPELSLKLLNRLAEWCIRFTPFVSIDLPDGLLFDSTGCAHLWGGEECYLNEIVKRINKLGFTIKATMADTAGAAWAIARFGSEAIVEKNKTLHALTPLPPQSLRLELETIEKLHKLGLRQINDFISMPSSVLRRRFGTHLIQRLNQATGTENEILKPIHPIIPFQERLPCLEPISTLPGIEIALKKLLETLCNRLRKEQKGVRVASFKCYRVDGKIIQVEIGTSRASYNVSHLFKLFELKLSTIEPGLGIELFVLDASKLDEHTIIQEKLWENEGGLEDTRISELIDRISGRIKGSSIRRYLPAEHYWPERSFKRAESILEKPTCDWQIDRPRPVQILAKPEVIEVTAPIPDYPPMLFRYQNKLHKIIKADGPERIEQEWWLQEGEHRDYYRVEDEDGNRYWLFRSGHYSGTRQWYLHGFFC